MSIIGAATAAGAAAAGAAAGAGAIQGVRKVGEVGNNLGIADLSIGVSVKGAYDYLDGINRQAISKAEEALNDTNQVTQTFKQGWQGKAEANFESNLYKATDTVIKELELIKTNIESLVAEMIEDWAVQDEALVEEADIVSF